MAKIQGRWIALLAITAVVVYLDWLMLLPFIDVLAWSTVLVILFYPLHRKILARVKSPSWSALLSCLLIIFVILIPLSLVIAAVVHEASGLADQLQSVGLSDLAPLDPDNPITGKFVRWIGHYVDLEHLRAPDTVTERLRSLTGSIASTTLGIVGGIIGAFIQILFIIFTMYYLFRDGEGIREVLKDLLPLDRARTGEIFHRTSEVISASVYGVLVIAIIQGTLGGIAFWVLGLPSPLLWGVVMTIASMIPVAGAFVVWVPAAIYLAATGSYVKAGLLVVWGALFIGLVDNFLRPKLVGERTRLHELLIFFSVLGGLKVFGILGLVLGPVIVAITLALIDVYREAERPAVINSDNSSAVMTQESLRNATD
jgi:predicted PurR-regulated permease PerM